MCLVNQWYVFLLSVESVCSPVCPAKMDWSMLYPKLFEQSSGNSATAPEVQFADIGCGYGGLLGNH